MVYTVYTRIYVCVYTVGGDDGVRMLRVPRALTCVIFARGGRWGQPGRARRWRAFCRRAIEKHALPLYLHAASPPPPPPPPLVALSYVYVYIPIVYALHTVHRRLSTKRSCNAAPPRGLTRPAKT